MFDAKRILAAFTLTALGACGSADVTTEDDDRVGTTTSALPHQACVNEYYSDASYSEQVGEWGCTCNSGCYQFGRKTTFRVRWCEDCGRPNPNLP